MEYYNGQEVLRKYRSRGISRSQAKKELIRIAMRFHTSKSIAEANANDMLDLADGKDPAKKKHFGCLILVILVLIGIMVLLLTSCGICTNPEDYQISYPEEGGIIVVPDPAGNIE